MREGFDDLASRQVVTLSDDLLAEPATTKAGEEVATQVELTATAVPRALPRASGLPAAPDSCLCLRVPDSNEPDRLDDPMEHQRDDQVPQRRFKAERIALPRDPGEGVMASRSRSSKRSPGVRRSDFRRDRRRPLVEREADRVPSVPGGQTGRRQPALHADRGWLGRSQQPFCLVVSSRHLRTHLRRRGRGNERAHRRDGLIHRSRSSCQRWR